MGAGGGGCGRVVPVGACADELVRSESWMGLWSLKQFNEQLYCISRGELGR
jgi:hypothetical protein